MPKELYEGYQVAPFPVMRRLAVDSARLSSMRNYMIGLLEFDVTEPRRGIQAYKAATRETLSFTAFIVHCLAKAIEHHKQVQAMPDWRGRLIIFDDVNITVLIEAGTEQGKIPVPYLLRRANCKSVQEIHNEIRACQKKPEGMKETRFMRCFLHLPWIIRYLSYNIILKHPIRSQKIICPVIVTAIGMFSTGGGWGVPAGNFSLAVTLGGITTKPGVVHGRIEPREYLCVTVSFDHLVLDGAPATRFVQEFRELVEQGDGLEEEMPVSIFQQVAG
jgi:chloramphenicol O-acetyltransferase